LIAVQVHPFGGPAARRVAPLSAGLTFIVFMLMAVWSTPTGVAF
jgi:hypothetical protein